jgi:hypothetical protein
MRGIIGGGRRIRDSIAGKIYDYYDDVNLVKVRFEPYYSSFVEMVPVSGFRAVGLSGGRVRLSWDRNSFASRYRIYWDNGRGVIDTVNVWVELDSSYTSYEAVLVDGLYRFGIVAVSYDGRRSIMVVDSVVADGTAPRLLYAFGVSRDSTISVKFSEPVKYDIVSDTGRWEFWGGIKVKSVFPKFVKGLEVRYYNGHDFKNLVRKDTIRSGNMSFDWGYGSPASGVSSDTFSVRFSGYVYIPVSGSYNFYVECNDRVNLIIGNDTLIYYGGYGSSVNMSFSPGLYRFIFEFVEDYGYAYFRLYWTVPGGSRVLMSVDNFMVDVDFSAYNLKLAGVLPVADTLVYVKVRGVEDFYGNRAGELRYDFHPDDGNSNPVVELISRIVEASSDIRVDYRISDVEGDVVRLRVEYSIDGGSSWRVGSVVGDTVDIGRDRYVGYIVWRSGLDLPGYDGEVIFRVTPRDNDPHNWGTPGEIRFRVDNYQRQKIKIALVYTLFEYSDSVKISYLIEDSTKDVLEIKVFYVKGLDSARVGSIGGVPSKVDSSRYRGTFIWLSKKDLDGFDGNVKLYVYASDGWGNGEGDSLSFKLDNNEIPSIAIAPIGEEVSDSVRIRYVLIDREGDTLRISFEYSLDSLRWRKGKVLGDTIISASGYASNIIWLSRNDLPGVDDIVYVKITPFDNDTGRAGVISIHLDNNYPPVAKIDSIFGLKRRTGAYRGDISFSFNLRDAEDDSAKIYFKFRYDSPDSIWRVATASGVQRVVAPGVYSVIWHTTDDLPFASGRYVFGIFPEDKDAGVYDSVIVNVDNIGVPAVISLSISDTSKIEFSGDITFNYRVIDEEGDTIRLRFDYSVDGGRSWRRATVLGDTILSDSSRYVGSIIWRSEADLWGVDVDSVLFRLTPYDRNMGLQYISKPFHLDNNEPPRITYIETPKVEVVGSYPMKFTSWDRERDTVKFIYEFMIEGDTSWRRATVGNLSKVGDTTIVIWRTDIDLFNRDVYVYFKVTPMDNDTGKAMTTGRFKVDNQTGPILISSSPLNVAFYNDTIVFKFDRKVRYNSVVSALNITGTRTGVHSFSITPSVDDSMFYVVAQPFFASAETVLISLSGDFANGVKDLLGNSLDGNKNGDPEGSPDDDIKISFITSLLGDFNLDRRVNLSDLNEFRKVWNGQIRHREIGPALGKPPQMIPQPDGKVDFEDLMVFVMNWNWTTRSGGFKLASKFGITDNGAGIASISLPIENKKGDVISAKFDEEMVKLVKLRNKNEYIRVGEVENDLVTYKVALSFPDSITALEVVLRYNPGILRVLEVKDLKAFDLVNGGRNVFLSYIDSVNGLIVVDVANFGKIDKVGEIEIASLTFSTQTKDETDVLLACEVITGRGEVYDITRVAKVSTKPEIPTRFELLQNFPNPFNPLTVIRFHVPQRSRVKIKIYDIIGREVSVPIDGEFDAGYYEFVWDSKDGSGKEVASGVYFYVMEAFGGNELLFRQIKKMVIIK